MAVDILNFLFDPANSFSYSCGLTEVISDNFVKRVFLLLFVRLEELRELSLFTCVGFKSGVG
jgi:hypothetical protein